ncbi:hypothetical protein OSB04_013439 [Centaurea solstitialis]|uniref:Pentatricopeptide repeat-containing protein n=1 Tax=Centaurea solstitialis TaxID=347529 RepID=A0AA38TD89_9ASTR|nr:hypothetical protein OSB04_013439 [Centaurea solstitialis]
MKRSWEKVNLHLSNRHSSPFSTLISLIQNPNSSKFSRQTSVSITTSSSSPDQLEGLIDPRFNPNPDPQSDPRISSNLAEEFAILQGSLSVHNPQSRKSSDIDLICNAIRDNVSDFDTKSRKFLSRFREKLSESLVVDVLVSLQNAELGIKFFLWAGRQIGYTHSLAVYETLLDIMGCNGNGNDSDNRLLPDRFLREIKDDDDKEVLGKLLNVLIRKHCQNGSWNLAIEELGRLKDLRYKCSKVTYNALMEVFLKSDKLDSACLVYEEMAELGHKLNGHTLGTFAYSLCKSGKWKEALDTVDKEKFAPDTILYTRMIGGLCAGSFFEEAMEFLNRMRSDSCVPNVLTYNTLLCGCLNKGKLGRCKRILSMMITEGCFPSLKIYNSLVHAYCKSDDFKYAFKLLKEMGRYGVKPGYVTYNIFIGGVCGSKEVVGPDKLEMAETAYRQMVEAGFALNRINVSNYARCLCEVGKFESAYNVISEMMSKGFVPDTSTYSNVISFLCGASKFEKAFWLFKEMKKNGVVPNVHTYTMLIDGFCKGGLILQARKWFDEMVTNGCPPNVVTYTALMHAYLKDKKIAEANELFEMMLSCDCSPNVVTITALIDGHCKAGDVEKALRIYERMKGKEIPDVNKYFTGKESNELEPNVVTYGALVDGLCKAHKVDEACKLLDVMDLERCEPNNIVYDALIDGLLKDGKLAEAQRVYSRMCERGYSPNVFTYGSMIDRMFKDNRLDLASQVLSNMLENSCPPNVVIYTEMVDGLCKVGKTDEAYRLMEMMEAKGCKPNVVTYTAMINGFGKMGKVGKSLEVFRQMGSKGCAPNYVTYTVLIHHCCVSGLLEEARGLLEEMKQTYWPKHMGSYRKVVEGFSREFLMNLGVLEGVSRYDSVPVISVYKLLFDGYRKAGELEVALELLNEVSSLCTSMDESMYFSLIESLSVSHRVEKAFELYADMIGKGGVPELSVFVNLVKGLVKVNRWEEAIQLSRSLCYMRSFLDLLDRIELLVLIRKDPTSLAYKNPRVHCSPTRTSLRMCLPAWLDQEDAGSSDHSEVRNYCSRQCYMLMGRGKYVFSLADLHITNIVDTYDLLTIFCKEVDVDEWTNLSLAETQF